MRFIAMSMVFSSRILVKEKTRNFLERFAFLIRETKEKVSLHE